MRSPVIAFGIFAAAAVSPTLVSGAPASPNLGSGVAPHLPANLEAAPLHAPPVGRDAGDVVTPPTINDHDRKKHKHKGGKRALDSGTAGGNAYTGGSSDSSGGTVVNAADEDGVIGNNLASEFITGLQLQ